MKVDTISFGYFQIMEVLIRKGTFIANQGKNLFGRKGDFKGDSVIIHTTEYVNDAPVQVWNNP
ncbi:hypothetical protein [Peribacillus simplex]|uniref:hypothetical protein n=1 Tax=Peribacillus simplex TaxID=1478 RepID=UPI003D267433